MKKITLFLIPFCCFFVQKTNAQIMTENYNSAQNWTHNGNNNTISIANGKLNFNQTHSSPDDEYLHRPIGFMLNDSKWQMDFEFTPNVGTPTGVSHFIASVTGNTSDPIATTWEPSVITNNSTISVFYDCEFGAQESTYFINIITKTNQSAYIQSPIRIVCPPRQTYYIRLERMSATRGIVSVFADAAHTQHQAGSPACFAISPEIKGLQYLQHGVWIAGHNDRAMTGSIDNLTIENNKNTSSTNTLKPIINGNPFLCAGGTATLTAYNTAYTSYVWSDGSTGSILNPMVAGVYTVTVTSGAEGCGSGSATIMVQSVKSPQPIISGAKVACKGSPVLLYAKDKAEINPNSTRYTWNTGITSDTIRASEGNYSLIATNTYGCTTVVEYHVLAAQAIEIPVLSVSGNELSVYQPSSFYVYHWLQNGKPVAKGKTFTIRETDLYQLCASNIDECTVCSAATVVVKQKKREKKAEKEAERKP
jgi:hypothetical protein